MICLFHNKEYKGIYYDTKDKSIILYSVTKCKKCGNIWKEEINKTEYKNTELLRKDLIVVKKTHDYIGDMV